MASGKAALKAIKVDLDAKKYEDAAKQARDLVHNDSKNFMAHLFLGRALDRLKQYDEAVKVYLQASRLKPTDESPWLGLRAVYEAQGGAKVDEYIDAAVKLAQFYQAQDDRDRCQTTVDKLLDFAKKNGNTMQIVAAYKTQLPMSPLYHYLEGRLPPPQHTFLRLIQTVEQHEDSIMKKEFEARRTRIGARKDIVMSEVRREVFDASELPSLYQGLIDWANDDEERREYEDKKLARAYEHLLVVKSEDKNDLRHHVVEMAHGMVIIKHPNALAWNIELEWKDIESIEELDFNVIQEYMQFFPDAGLTKVLSGWLSSELNTLPSAVQAPAFEDSDDEPDVFGNGVGVPLVTPEDRLQMMIDGVSEAKSSPLAHRIVAEYYNHLEEYEMVVETIRKGLHLCQAERRKSGLPLRNNLDAMNTILANALIVYQSPRHHLEAKLLFDDILQRKPAFTPALLGSGLILEEEQNWAAALEYLDQALKKDANNVRVGVEAAWCRAQTGDIANGLKSLQQYLEKMSEKDQASRELKAETLYRIGQCQWDLDTSRTARKNRNGAYSNFLAAIKCNINYAPAYTSLGIYYEDYRKDRKRARQCFQKAFDLSASELVAAEKLARLFADQKDWDIVEVISQRVVDSGKARPPPGSRRKAISWPYSALGVVQMNRQDFQKAIVSFLAALRISPDDYHSYVGLGESYHNSGRYNSALKTFSYVLNPDDGATMQQSSEDWFTNYMLANVSRELGSYEEAEMAYRAVLKDRKNEFGVELALAQTLIEHAWRAIDTGFFGRAIDCARQSLEVASSVVQYNTQAFNLWRAIADACSIYTWSQDYASHLPRELIHSILSKDSSADQYDLLAKADGVTATSLEKLLQEAGADGKESQSWIVLANTSAVLARKRAIHSSARNVHAQAVAWYNLGWTEYRAHICLEQRSNTDGRPAKSKKYLKAATKAFKRAIELEASNAEFWNALGVTTTKLNPKIAQHAFVRSLHLNEQSAKVWTNLGALYMLQNDLELAHAAFSKAQSADPDYTHAWVGEGNIALLSGDEREALLHFTHAFEISDASTTIVKKQFAAYAFDNIIASKSADDARTIQPVLALRQLRALSSSNAPFDHLAALLHERNGDHAAATNTLEEVSTTLENAYEETESEAILAKFVQAKTDLARNYLAAGQYAEAASEAQTALDLMPEELNTHLDKSLRHKIQLSARLTIGLSKYYLQDMDSALAAFRPALQETNASPDVLCSLAEVLWAKGGAEERSVAKEQLFEAINHANESGLPTHVGTIVLLAAMVAIEDDRELMDAVIEELEPLQTRDDVSSSDLVRVQLVLEAIRELSAADHGEDAKDAALHEIQRMIVLAPFSPLGWSQLATYTAPANGADQRSSSKLQATETSVIASSMALSAASRQIPPRGGIGTEQYAEALAGTCRAGDAQRAIMVAPWSAVGYLALANAVSAGAA